MQATLLVVSAGPSLAAPEDEEDADDDDDDEELEEEALADEPAAGLGDLLTASPAVALTSDACTFSPGAGSATASTERCRAGDAIDRRRLGKLDCVPPGLPGAGSC